MFDHVKFGVSDYAASKAFFLKALERTLGVTATTRSRDRLKGTDHAECHC
jgi:catechol 2,3-dioxygenase-like lactoylglutathione lyase family enzyme